MCPLIEKQLLLQDFFVMLFLPTVSLLKLKSDELCYFLW